MEGTMLAELDPDQEVPDAIYLASLEHAVTSEEIAFRDVLVFHRDCLNGGLDQAMFNREKHIVQWGVRPSRLRLTKLLSFGGVRAI
jgi:hypothetical protein